MKPHIDAIRFGTITIAGQVIKHDIVITLGGKVKERKRKLSKQVYGTSHIISLAEAEAIWEKSAKTLIIGTGLFDRVRLSAEAQAYLAQQGCGVELRPIKKAVRLWNESRGQIIGLFHITC